MTRKPAKTTPAPKAAVPAVAKFEGFKFTISSTDATGEKMIGEICFYSALLAMRWLRESVLSASGESTSYGVRSPTNIKENSGIKSFDLRIVSG